MVTVTNRCLQGRRDSQSRLPGAPGWQHQCFGDERAWVVIPATQALSRSIIGSYTGLKQTDVGYRLPAISTPHLPQQIAILITASYSILFDGHCGHLLRLIVSKWSMSEPFSNAFCAPLSSVDNIVISSGPQVVKP